MYRKGYTIDDFKTQYVDSFQVEPWSVGKFSGKTLYVYSDGQRLDNFNCLQQTKGGSDDQVLAMFKS